MSSGGGRANASASASASKSKQLKRKKNALRSRKDPGWEYATDIDGDSKKTKCKFCSKVFSGGIFRFKHHLARTKENVEPCFSVPDDVRKQMLDILDLNLEAKEARKNLLHRGINITAATSATRSQETIYSTLGASGSNSLPPTRTQTTMSTLLKKDLRRDAAKSIARWFYLTGTSFNAAREPEYYTMFELAARHGPGCSIMSDGWTDRKRRSICNFLVNSPKGTVFIESLDTSNYSKNTQKVFEMLDDVVEKVGEENVIQVITDNASAYKAAGVKLMEKKLPIHKTTIAKGRKITNYIYGRAMLISMLKDFTKGGELIRPALTRFATAYLTLGFLNEHKGDLMSMFSSETWRKSTFSSTREGKRIQGIILDSKFWTSVLTCLRDAMPLMKVLRLVDSDESPLMPFLYLELNQAMEKIKNNFSNIEKR
ncbi:hypothetical protein LINPERHAP2_LOCUS7153 [Linum perenne]